MEGDTLATTFQPGDKVLVLSGPNKGILATFKKIDAEGKACCRGPGNRLHRIHISPDKLKLIKRQVLPTG